MRAIWIDEGNDANEAKLLSEGITSPCFAIRDPRVTISYLDGLRARGFTPGVYAVLSWYGVSPQGFATTVSMELERIGARSFEPGHPFVCLDYEPTDAGGMLACALQWRKHRPSRVTDLTLEGHHGSRFTRSQLQTLAKRFRYLVPQSYNGAMNQGWDTNAICRNLIDAGAPYSSVTPFVDARLLRELAWWEGYAFTQGRLPS